MNFAFYVSGRATRLSKIIKESTNFLVDVKVVFSDDRSNQYLKEKLNELGIEYIVKDYKEYVCAKNMRNSELSNLLLEVLTRFHVDYCFSFGAHILKGELLEVYKNRIINFHPSILPAYPGIRSIDRAIADKANLLGNTAHFIDAGVDTGPIIMQSVHHTDSFYSGGYDEILDVQIQMLYKISALLKTGRIIVDNGKVKIKDADYSSYEIFPHLTGPAE